MKLIKGLECAILTGSRIFGYNTKESDWDIVIPMNYMGNASDLINLASMVVDSHYFNGKMLHFSGVDTPINLIFVHPHEFKIWHLATLAMATVWKAMGISNSAGLSVADKHKAHGMFEGFRATFKMVLPELNDSLNYEQENCKLALESQATFPYAYMQLMMHLNNINRPARNYVFPDFEDAF